jgi:hypothetical protein
MRRLVVPPRVHAQDVQGYGCRQDVWQGVCLEVLDVHISHLTSRASEPQKRMGKDRARWNMMSRTNGEKSSLRHGMDEKSLMIVNAME